VYLRDSFTMSGALSKRQQARNERTLQELIKTVPGNNSCADCGTSNPGESCVIAIMGRRLTRDIGWASWSVSRSQWPADILGKQTILTHLFSWVFFYACDARRYIESWERTSLR
jgi:hypothetical protein